MQRATRIGAVFALVGMLAVSGVGASADTGGAGYTCAVGEGGANVCRGSAVVAAAAPQPAPGATVIAGAVRGDGAIVAGTGFTVTQDFAGRYTVSFPSGTWSSAPIPVVNSMAAGRFFYLASVVYHADGSAAFTVDFGGANTPFVFTATASGTGLLASCC